MEQKRCPLLALAVLSTLITTSGARAMEGGATVPSSACPPTFDLSALMQHFQQQRVEDQKTATELSSLRSKVMVWRTMSVLLLATSISLAVIAYPLLKEKGYIPAWLQKATSGETEETQMPGAESPTQG